MRMFSGTRAPGIAVRPLLGSSSGTTLLELLVTLTLMTILSTIAALASRQTAVPAIDSPELRIGNARRAALASGQPVSLLIEASGAPRMVTALPDGRLLADTGLHIDRLTGRRRDTTGKVGSHVW